MDQHSKKITCIICAFNEEKYLPEVLKVVTNYPKFDEIIVVDDGSTDKTNQVTQEFSRVKLITHTHNQGKAAAIASGVEQAQGEILVFLDADLIGLQPENLDLLLKPQLEQECLTLSLRANSMIHLKYYKVDPWSGERTLPTWVMKHINFQKAQNYLIEAAINEVILQKKLPIFSAPWPNVNYVKKTEKIGKIKGLIAETQMVLTIYFKMGILRTLRQLRIFLTQRQLVT